MADRGAYLVLGGIWILFRVNVFGAFPPSKSMAKASFLGGEELAWYGNVVSFLGDGAFFGDDGVDETLEGWRRW